MFRIHTHFAIKATILFSLFPHHSQNCFVPYLRTTRFRSPYSKRFLDSVQPLSMFFRLFYSWKRLELVFVLIKRSKFSHDFFDSRMFDGHDRLTKLFRIKTPSWNNTEVLKDTIIDIIMFSRFPPRFVSSELTTLGEAAYVQRRRIHEKRHRDAIQGKKQEEQVWWRPRPRSDHHVHPFCWGYVGWMWVLFLKGRSVGWDDHKIESENN